MKKSSLPVQAEPDQLDLFALPVVDLLLKDGQEVMERPFLCVSERPTRKTIEYTSPDGNTWIKVTPHQDLGMATIQDWSIMIWLASQIWIFINEHKERPSRTIKFHPYNLLTSIGKGSSKHDYKWLGDALDRLQGTQVKTSIRAKDQVGSTFSWIESWRRVEDPDSEKIKYWEVTLGKWIYEGIINKSKVLTLHPHYFDLRKNKERWMYRVARKHAGDQSTGFALRLDTLYEKSGKIRSERQWKSEMRAWLKDRVILNYSFDVYQNDKGEDIVHMIRADLIDKYRSSKFGAAATMRVVKKSLSKKKSKTPKIDQIEKDRERFSPLHKTAHETVVQLGGK